MLFCNKYNGFREFLFADAINKNENFLTLPYAKKLRFLFVKCSRQTARFIRKSFSVRTKYMFQ